MGVLNIHPEKVNLHIQGANAAVCGWSTENPLGQINIADANYSDNLQCVELLLYGNISCRKLIQRGNFKDQLLCGKSDSPDKITTLVNMLQSS